MTRRTRLRIATALALVGLSPGCEDSDLLAPSDGRIEMIATPSSVQLPEDGSPVTSRIGAQVFDGAGYAMVDVTVRFTTTSGTLASNGEPRETDNRGASDVLTMTINDTVLPVTVTAKSGEVTGTVVIGCGDTTAPTDVSPQASPDELASSATDRDVALTATASDPESDALSYRWTCSPGSLVAEGPTSDGNASDLSAWTVTVADAGETDSTLTCTVVVTNECGLTAQGSVDIDVLASGPR